MLLALLWVFAAALVFLLLFFSTANIALRSRSVLVVAERLEQTGREAELRWLTEHRGDLTLATASVRTLVSLMLVVDIIALCEGYGFEGGARYLITIACSFFLILTFSVVVPTTVVQHAAGAAIAAAMPFYKPLRIACLPVISMLGTMDRLMRHSLGVPLPTPESEADDIEQAILNVVGEGKLQGAVDEHETEMIRSVMEFSDTEVSAIMTPRTDIVAIEKTATLAEAKRIVAETGHSRIPVLDDNIDNILGVLYAKDLLPMNEGDVFDVTKVMRSVPYIPESKPVNELLQELRSTKIHIAIVLDEYGGTGGLVTIEDILEELVGEIADEYEQHEPEPIERIDTNTVDVDARMHIDEINDELDLDLPEDDEYETLGGFVFSTMGRIPSAGEQFRHNEVTIRVLDAEPRRINRLRLLIERAETAGGNSNGR